ncbi:MAG: hypothetical protein ABH883_03490 [Candidatus Omnitrophota bacterium]
MKKFYWLLIFIVLVGLTGIITCRVFESNFAEFTIDWFAFLAGIYLILEGTYKIVVNIKTPVFPGQFLRALRVIIGVCVFTIHLLQFMRH